jgi:hypothetical protein
MEWNTPKLKEKTESEKKKWREASTQSHSGFQMQTIGWLLEGVVSDSQLAEENDHGCVSVAAVAYDLTAYDV